MGRFTRQEDIDLAVDNAKYNAAQKRLNEMDERIKAKNIVLWDEVICDREIDWIYQWRWKYTGEVTKDTQYWNVRYYVQFERNGITKTYPIHIDKITKAVKRGRKKK